jgi:hypothetical protein
LKKYSENALEFSRNYDWSSVCKQVANVYDQVTR